MVDETASTGTTSGHADPACAHKINDLGDGEEVPGETQVRDGAQFVLESRLCLPLLGGADIALRYRDRAAFAQKRVCLPLWIADRATDEHIEFGDKDLPDTQIGRFQCAVFCQSLRIGEQSMRIPLPCGARDLIGHLMHLFAALEKGLSVAGADVPGIQRHQSTRSIKNICGTRIVGPQIADRVGEHRRQLLFARPPEHRGGSSGGVRVT